MAVVSARAPAAVMAVLAPRLERRHSVLELPVDAPARQALCRRATDR